MLRVERHSNKEFAYQFLYITGYAQSALECFRLHNKPLPDTDQPDQCPLHWNT